MAADPAVGNHYSGNFDESIELIAVSKAWLNRMAAP